MSVDAIPVSVSEHEQEQAGKAGRVALDVRSMVPKERHPRIFGLWDELNDGMGIELINDHDPLPLYYQFAAEFSGQFHWHYLERGPGVWRVAISKGTFADPGFRPEPRAGRIKQAPASFVEPAILDIRPVFASGGSPCGMIDEAVSNLIPGQSLVLLAPFEPRPLFTKLGKLGFTAVSEPCEDGSWRIEFRPGIETPRVAPGSLSCGCGH